jgi:hypothetical protein
VEQDDLLRRAVGAFERLGLRYFVTGSVATIFYGEPRFTADIDVVVDLPAVRIPGLCAEFPSPEFYLSEESARRAVARRGQFNLIHPTSGLKLDFMIPADTEHNRSRFARVRKLSSGPGFEALFASPEDVILKKLEFYREGGSDKHLRDIASVLKTSGHTLDLEYLATWARRLGVDDLWRAVLERTEPER